MSLYNLNEEILKNRISKVYLKMLTIQHGTTVRLYKTKKDVYSKVYGVQSGEISNDFEEMQVLITADTFGPSDSRSSGILTEGWMYSSLELKLNTGDHLEVKRKDKKFYKYKVESIESLGITTDVSTRYKIVSIG